MKSARNSWADHVPDRLQKEVYPGAEIPFVPVGPDVLDGGDGLEGVGVDGLVTGSSGVAGWLVVSGGGVSDNYQSARNLS